MSLASLQRRCSAGCPRNTGLDKIPLDPFCQSSQSSFFVLIIAPEIQSVAVPCALIPPQMLPCAGGATGRLCPRDEALKCALKSLEGSKPLESFRRDVPSITGQCQYLPQLLCEDRGGTARLCLPFREKLRSLWDVAAISAQLFLFPSVRKPLIYEL